MRFPLAIKETASGYAIIDADGVRIASAMALPWAGVAEHQQPETVKRNLDTLVDAANAISAASAAQVLEPPTRVL